MKQTVLLLRAVKKKHVILACVVLPLCGGIFTIGFLSGEYSTHSQSLTSAKTTAGSSSISLVEKSVDVSDINIYDLWQDTNQVRVANGLSQLTLNPFLNASASAKCTDMVTKNYWSHNDPSGTEPWHFITDTGLTYHTAGENLASAYDSAQAVFNGWMASPEHKANILNPAFDQVGFAVCKSNANFAEDPGAGPVLLVVQHLIN